jgi:hypothetical protein
VSWYEHFGDETLRHVELLEQAIAAAGGNPAYVSPSARATEKAAAGLLESTFMLDGSLDQETAELVMLEAVMLAEAKDRANWEMLTQLAAQVTDEALRQELESLTGEVLAQEVEHHSWARDTRAAMLITRAGGNAMAMSSAGAEGDGGTSKAALYEAAKRLGIEGRSTMTKEQLEQAVAQAGGQR